MRAASVGDGCILTNGPGSLGGVSINIALFGRDETAVASDGLVIDKDGIEMSSSSHKSCRMNNRLCFVSGGRSTHAKIMLCQLDKRADSLDSQFPEDDWERRKLKAGKSYAEAHDALSVTYKSIFVVLAESGQEPLDSCFMLCGGDRKSAGVAFYALARNKKGKLVPDIQTTTTDGRIRNFIAGIPGDNSLYTEVRERLDALEDLDDAESVLVEQIRKAALHDESLHANGNILTRRLSDKFRAQWHELPSNSPAQARP